MVLTVNNYKQNRALFLVRVPLINPASLTTVGVPTFQLLHRRLGEPQELNILDSPGYS